jgi:hypothetical protein
VLMATVNGLGRLVPTPALNKTMLHRAAGGLEDPYLNRTLYLYNEPSTVTVSQLLQVILTVTRIRRSSKFCSTWVAFVCRGGTLNALRYQGVGGVGGSGVVSAARWVGGVVRLELPSRRGWVGPTS